MPDRQDKVSSVADSTARVDDKTPLWQRREPVDVAAYQAWLDRQNAATQAPLAEAAAEMTELTPALVPLNHARGTLQSQASRAELLLERVRVGTVDPADASTQLGGIAAGMLGPLDAIAKATLEGDARTRASVARWMPDVRGALDAVARAALGIAERRRVADVLLGGDFTRRARVDDGAGARAALDGSIASLVAVAMPIGWRPAVTLAEADERRFAIEACPTGAREDRPDVCDMSDGEREKMRDRVRWRLVEVVEDFEAACAPHKAQLEAFIARHAATDQLVLGILKSGLSMALGRGIDAAVTAIASRAPSTVPHNPYHPGWKPSDPQDDIAPPKQVYSAAHFAADLAQDKMWHSISRGPREQKTLGMLDQLIAGVKVGARETRWLIGRLDDNGLRSVEGSLALIDRAYFAAKLDPFVADYREQIEPLGTMSTRDPRAAEGGPGQIEGLIESVWVVIGDRRRLAQVATQYDAGSLLAHDYRSPQSRRFVRWIDQRFESIVGAQSLVGGQSPEVTAGSIEGMPLHETSTWMLDGGAP